MNRHQFVHELNRLLRVDVVGLSAEDKARVVAAQAHAFANHEAMRDVSLAFVPFTPGRRPIDEARHPGLGASEASALLANSGSDELVLLYRLKLGGRSTIELPPGARLEATLHWLDADDASRMVVPGWSRREIDPCRIGAEGDDAEERACFIAIDVNGDLAPLRDLGVGPSAPFGFGSLFHESFRLELALVVDGLTLASDTFTFDIYDERGFGALYQRIAEVLLPRDMASQAVANGVFGTVPTAFHPWFPVLCIGMEKANLYMRAIAADIVSQKRMLADPSWLLEVGLYLELLTCLGIFEAVKGEVDLLTPEERRLFETSPAFAEIRARIDVAAWRRVWALRFVAFARTLALGDTPIGFQNLIRKRSATLAFLHAHHDDLKHAIALAGPNLINSQETWHRVFRDAERAVLKMNDAAFPELRYLGDQVRSFVLWHRQGSLAGFRLIPSMFSGSFGDQDGLFASACRQYRASMNDVARWASQRGLMDYTGAECVPVSASLLESHLARDQRRLERLQRRDGFLGNLSVEEIEQASTEVAVDDVVRGLGRVRLFELLTQDELAQLARMARPVSLGPLERVVVQGTRATSLFVVHDGELEVITKDGQQERTLAQLGRGAIIDEHAFLTGQLRPSSVRALHSAVVIEVGAAQLQSLVERRPALLDALCAALRQRGREVATHTDEGLARVLRQAIFGAQG